MDLLKQLSEAKAQGLSKEEFFRVLDAEIKLSEHKQQTLVGSDKGSAASSADVSKPLAKFLQDVDERLKTLEQQQSARLNEFMREQQQQLQQFQQQHQQHFQQFQQQQQQQLQHLQQQQERQHVEHIQQLQQQQQQMLTQVQQFQKQMRTVQTQPSQHGGEASDVSKEHRKEKQNFDTALSQVKENFHEMRNTVLNRLEEEKIYMRDELNKAQHELKADLSKVAANVTEIKDKMQVIDFVKMRDNVGQIRQCYEKLARNIQEKDSGKLERKKILDRVNAAQGNVQQTIRKMAQELKDAITIHVTELKESADENALKLRDDLEDVTADIIAVSDNEYQLLKNCLNHEGKPPEPCKTYVCDLNVTNFEESIFTEETLDSLPWYIDQFHSCIKSLASFTEEGDMEAWVLYGRKPRRVGLQPQSDISAKVKASVVDLTGNKEPLFIAEEVWYFNENEIQYDGGDWGIKVGSIKCAQVIDMGLVNDDGTIFIRFEVEML